MEGHRHHHHRPPLIRGPEHRGMQSCQPVTLIPPHPCPALCSLLDLAANRPCFPRILTARDLKYLVPGPAMTTGDEGAGSTRPCCSEPASAIPAVGHGSGDLVAVPDFPHVDRVFSAWPDLEKFQGCQIPDLPANHTPSGREFVLELLGWSRNRSGGTNRVPSRLNLTRSTRGATRIPCSRPSASLRRETGTPTRPTERSCEHYIATDRAQGPQASHIPREGPAVSN